MSVIAQESFRTGRGARGRGAVSPSPVRCQVMTATVIRAFAARKWPATVHGFRPIHTVMPPITALLITIQNCAQAQRVRLRRHGLVDRAAMIAQPTAADRTYVSIRLPNSIMPR